MRRILPRRRAAETFNLRFWNQPFTVTVGFYADGTPGEVFIDGGKTGQDVQSTARDAAVVLSLALQHGTPIEAIRHAPLETFVLLAPRFLFPLPPFLPPSQG